MPEDTYFVLTADEDGGHCRQYNKDELMKYLEDLGETDAADNIVNKLPKNNEMNYWGDSIVIIKGEVVVPRKKEVVVKYEI